jgi:hypothetical protein
MRVCRSPKLIAAYHGLHRLRVPRHPPHAFTRLTTTICDQAERPTIFQLQTQLSSEQSIEIDRLSIRILKSAIYHAFRCQIAMTLIVRALPEGSPGARRRSRKLNLGLDVSRRATYGILSADQEIRRAHGRFRARFAFGTPAACATVSLLVYPLRR